MCVCVACPLFWGKMPMRSNESIPRPGSLCQQKVIAKVLTNLERFADQERKRKKKVEQKGEFKK